MAFKKQGTPSPVTKIINPQIEKTDKIRVGGSVTPPETVRISPERVQFDSPPPEPVSDK